jgi:hypothetical protein
MSQIFCSRQIDKNYFKIYTLKRLLELLMIPLSHNLELNEKQINFLSYYGIDPQVAAIHIIEGSKVHQTLSDVNAYFAGQYIFFFQGDSGKHSLFLKTILKTSQNPALKGYHAGISLYSTWLSEYINNDSEVKVTIALEATEVTYSM